MKLVGGDPCLDFVNTVGGRAHSRVRADKLASYSDLVGFAEHAGLVSASAARRLKRKDSARPREGEAALQRARAFREALYAALRALMLGERPTPPLLRTLNTELAASRSRERLVLERGRLLWGWAQAAERLESPLWPVARAASALLTSPELTRLRQCGGQACGWLFLDRSRNRSRQWCTMQDCGNLSKVRRFRKRQRRIGP
jgi:predicted RNA-binding Zn ribbon-like protein